MSTSAEHADWEVLSAYVDGEAPEWEAHVAGCPSCAASAEALRAVAGAVAVPVEPPPAAVREAALSAASGGGTPGGNRMTPAPVDRRRVRGGRLLGAVAAMFLVIVGVTALLNSSGGSSTRRSTVAGPAAEVTRPLSGNAGAAADSTAAGPPADLGDVPDAATLLARAGPSLAAGAGGQGGNAGSAANSGAASSAAGTATPPAPSVVAPGAVLPGTIGPSSGGAATAPQFAGTRPCEEQARARQPSLGPVVYFATARSRGAPAVVLGFSTGPAPAPVTLLLLAQDGCGELLRAVGP